MGRMSKIRVKVVARTTHTDDLKIEKYIECTDDSSRQRRLEGRHAQTTSTSTNTDNFKLKYTQTTSTTRPILVPSSKKKRLFDEFFHSKIWNCRKFSIYLHHERHSTSSFIHTFIHTIECFSKRLDIYQQRASSK